MSLDRSLIFVFEALLKPSCLIISKIQLFLFVARAIQTFEEKEFIRFSFLSVFSTRVILTILYRFLIKRSSAEKKAYRVNSCRRRVLGGRCRYRAIRRETTGQILPWFMAEEDQLVDPESVSQLLQRGS